MTNYEHIAEKMYAAYSQQAGGLTFDGRPLPSFSELGLERQSCWKAAAEASKMVAPVVLPEPVSARYRLLGVTGLGWTPCYLEFARSQAGGVYELEYLFTEQQVRELLAQAPCTKAQTTTQEPFGYFKCDAYGWMDCAETDEGARPLYEAPQPQADALDTERLDWLVGEGNAVVQEGSVGFWVCWIDGENSARDEYQLGEYPTAREAIDAAIAAAKENK